MDAIATLAEKGLIPPVAKSSGPRPASSYRAARRNHVKAARGLQAWREYTAVYANQAANIHGRHATANGAREVAAKALVDAAVKFPGLRHDVVVASAQLAYYREQKQTRPVRRIIRALERQVRA